MTEPVKGFQTNEGTKQYDYNALANKPTLITQDQVDAALKAAKEYTDEKIKNVDVNDGDGIDISGAAPGQTIVIKEVDEAGKPITWEPVDFNNSPGAPGKTAYEYAQDAGYTGTEEEFAKKLADDTPAIDSEEVNELIDTKLHSVASYGAKGDGSVDDTKAFQNALAYNRVVYVPGGTYSIGDTLVIRENCCLELSQDTVLKFTKTSGNCIEMRGSAVLRGNHGMISVPYAFGGNVISMDTSQDGTNHNNIPPYLHAGSHMFKRQRFVYDINILKPDANGICKSTDGTCTGTAIYMHCLGTASIRWMWAITMSGVRIAGGFSYGIRAYNIDKSGDYEDNAWNHDMRIEAVIENCEIGVALENCNGAHLAVTIQPHATQSGVKYAKHGVYLNDSKYVDMIGSRVWDWNDTNTLWTPGGQYQHLALIGNCRGLILDDFLVHESSMPIRDLIYTDIPENFDKMTILQEPGGSKNFKAVNGEPYFNDGNSDIRLASKSDIDEYFVTGRIKGYTDVLSTAIDTDGSIYNEIGYAKYGGALNSAGAIIPDTNSWYGHTGFIACKPGDVIYIKGIKLTEADGYTKAFTYNANFNLLGQNNLSAILAGTTVSEFTGTATEDGGTLTVVRQNTAYMRIGFKSVFLGDDPVIAVNEEIKYTQAGFLADDIKVKSENVIGNVVGGNVDLTGYATEQWVQDQNYLKSIPDGYVTSTELEGEVSSALAQAKQNGDFKGDPGDDYILTEADKQEIANMIQIPDSSENKVLIIDASGDEIAYSSDEIIELVKQGYNISLCDGQLIYTLSYIVESNKFALFSSTSYLGNLLQYASIEVDSNGQLSKQQPTITQVFDLPPFDDNANHILKASSSGVDWVNFTNEVINIVTENFTNVAEVGA